LDPTYREALRATMGSKAVDDEMCRRSYNHSGRRYLMASRLNYDRSCSTREEHRMSLTLFEAIMTEWNRRGNPELRPTEDRIQFYVHPTRVVNQFSEMVTLPIVSWYQATAGMAYHPTFPPGAPGARTPSIILCVICQRSFAPQPGGQPHSQEVIFRERWLVLRN
jgi:hypothetical protein